MKSIFTVLLSVCLLNSFSQQAQPYLPSTDGTPVNRPIGATNFSTDSRSQFHDRANFLWRDYRSTAEVLSTLNTAGHRKGHVLIFIRVGGTLGSTGLYTGGTTEVWWFKSGVADSDLVPFSPTTVFDTTTIYAQLATKINLAQARAGISVTGTGLTYNSTTGVITWSGGSGAGVTSVGLTVPSGLSVSGSPITSSGNLSITTSLNGILRGNGSGFTAGGIDTTDISGFAAKVRSLFTAGSGLTYSNGVFSSTVTQFDPTSLTTAVNAAYNNIFPLSDSSGFELTRPNGSRDTVKGSFGSSGGGGGTGNGTVTSVSATVPLGFNASVSTNTTTPVINIGTTLNGVVKGNGSGFTAGKIDTSDIIDFTKSVRAVQDSSEFDANDFYIDANTGAVRIRNGPGKVLPDANYTILLADRTLILPDPTATRTLTLPVASALSRPITIYCWGTSTGEWVLSGAFVQKTTTGGSLAENFSNSGLAPGQLLHLVPVLLADGTTWRWFDMP